MRRICSIARALQLQSQGSLPLRMGGQFQCYGMFLQKRRKHSSAPAAPSEVLKQAGSDVIFDLHIYLLHRIIAIGGFAAFQLTHTIVQLFHVVDHGVQRFR